MRTYSGVCMNCGKTFTYEAKRKRRKCCSRECVLAVRSATMKDTWKRGAIAVQKRDHAGDKNPRWNGGTHLTHQGYRYVWAPDHPAAVRGKVLEHRLVAEESLGRPLRSDEVVHHINGDKTDNRSENLQVLTNSQHIKEHDAERERDALGRYT